MASYLSLLNAEVKCAICLETFTSPRVLTCLHSFCEPCLEKHQTPKTAPGTISCPLCRKITVLRQDVGISGLSKDFRAVALIEKMEKASREQLQQKKKQVTKQCEVCGEIDTEGTTLYVYCSDCEQVMCQKCGDLHRKMKISQHHTLTAVSSSNTQIPKGKRSGTDKLVACVKHKGRKMDLFCSTCLIPVCQICCVQSHRNHKCDPVKLLAPTMREDISSRLSKASELVSEGKELLAVTNKLEQSLKILNNRIEATCTSYTDRWKYAQTDKNGKFLHSQMDILGETQRKVECHLESLKKIQNRANEVLVPNKTHSLASAFKELKNSLDDLLCRTPDRSSIEIINKTLTHLQFQVNHETRLGALVIASAERRNIGVKTQFGPHAVTFTRDGRLALCASFEGPMDSSQELSYHLKNYRGEYYAQKQDIFEQCSYYAIKQTNAAYWVAGKFGMERTVLNNSLDTLASLSELRFVMPKVTFYSFDANGIRAELTMVSEKCKGLLKFQDEISSVVTDLDDNIYVSCTKANVIYVVRPDGSVNKAIPTGVLQPKLIAVCPCSPDRIIFTHDSSMVSIIDCNGKLLHTITRHQWKEVAIGCDNKKLLYVLWKGAHNLRSLQRFNMEGRLLDTLIDAESHGCQSLLLSVAPEGSACVVTDVGDNGNVTLITNTRQVDVS